MYIEKAKRVLQLSERARLLQFVEECAEAAHAAAKLARILDGENPSPVSEEKAREMLTEEVADVYASAAVLRGVEPNHVAELVEAKIDRWADRLQEAGEPENVAVWDWDPNGMDWGIGAWRCSKCCATNNNLPGDPKINPRMMAGSKFCPQCGRRITGAINRFNKGGEGDGSKK